MPKCENECEENNVECICCEMCGECVRNTDEEDECIDCRNILCFHHHDEDECAQISNALKNKELIEELKDEIKELKDEISELEKENDKLKKKIVELDDKLYDNDMFVRNANKKGKNK